MQSLASRLWLVETWWTSGGLKQLTLRVSEYFLYDVRNNVPSQYAQALASFSLTAVVARVHGYCSGIHLHPISVGPVISLSFPIGQWIHNMQSLNFRNSISIFWYFRHWTNRNSSYSLMCCRVLSVQRSSSYIYEICLDLCVSVWGFLSESHVKMDFYDFIGDIIERGCERTLPPNWQVQCTVQR